MAMAPIGVGHGLDLEDLSGMNSGEIAQLVGGIDDVTAQQIIQQIMPPQPPRDHHQPQPHNPWMRAPVQETEPQPGGPAMMYPPGVHAPPGYFPAPPHPQATSHNRPHQPPAGEEPWVEIVEQPKSRGLRFRYECEGRSAGSVPGENSTNDHRTYPTIRIHNYSGPAIIVVSCVTKESPPHCKPHPHAIVGRDCKKGVCTLRVKDTSEKIVFPNIGIQCAKKKDVEGALRLRKEINVDPYQTGFDHSQSNIDLNVVRLCFQVFLPNDAGRVTKVVPPVCSHAIHDKKSSKDLVICRVDKTSGKARGGDEVFLLCDKVNKEDIKVRFYEEDERGNVAWEDFGDFGQGDVHKQCAIVFRTPAYYNQYITKPAEVNLQLYRPSDQEASEGIPFAYMPEDPDPDRIAEKRKRKAAKFLEYWNSPAGANYKRGSGASVRGRLHTKLVGHRRIKKEPGLESSLGGAEGGAAGGSGDAPMSHVTADNSSMGSVTVSSISAGSLDSNVIAELSGLSSSDLSVVSTENGQLVISVSGGEEGLSVDSINLPTNMLSGELMNQIDIQQLNAYLQDQGSNSDIGMGSTDGGHQHQQQHQQQHHQQQQQHQQQHQQQPQEQHHPLHQPQRRQQNMETDLETETALRGLNSQM